MGTLGTFLRDAREKRGIDLRDASQQTRIGINYLRALEEENFSKLPGEVFVKGFLKNYCKFLALDETVVLQKYAELKLESATAASEAKAEREAVVQTEQLSRRIVIEPFLWAGGILIALVLFFILALPSRQPQKTGPGSVSKISGQPGTSNSKGEKLYLEVVALENTWLLLRTDTSPQKKAVLKKGESLTWSADERFQLSYGSAGALKLVLNGKELEVKMPATALVRDLTVTASGILSKKIQQDPAKSAKTRPQQQMAANPPHSAQSVTTQAVKPRQDAPVVKKPAVTSDVTPGTLESSSVSRIPAATQDSEH